MILPMFIDGASFIDFWNYKTKAFSLNDDTNEVSNKISALIEHKKMRISYMQLSRAIYSEIELSNERNKSADFKNIGIMNSILYYSKELDISSELDRYTNYHDVKAKEYVSGLPSSEYLSYYDALYVILIDFRFSAEKESGLICKSSNTAKLARSLGIPSWCTLDTNLPQFRI
jgi:hypothetical protein